MCTRHVRLFGRIEKAGRAQQQQAAATAEGGGSSGHASPCPQLDVAFLRNLHILTNYRDKYECTQRQLAAHPCKGVPSAKCKAGFIAAMV